MRPREHRVVDGAFLGGDRLALDHAEDPGPSAVEVTGHVHRQDRFRHGRRLFLERPDRRALHREAVLAHPPDVDAEHEHDGDGQDGDVQRVEAQEGGLADLVATDQQVLQPSAEERHVLDQVGADGDGPVAELVPRQQVPGEGERQREHEERHPEDPVELARALVGPGEEGPDQVQHHDEHHQVGGPPVHVADQLPESDAGAQVLHVAVRRAHRRRVEEHEVDPGDHQDDEQHRGDEAEPERVADAQHPGGNLHRVEVQEEVRERLERTTPRRLEGRVAEHRPPDVASLDPGTQAPTRRERRLGLERVAGHGLLGRRFSHRDLPCVHHRESARRAAVHAEPTADAQILAEQQHALRRLAETHARRLGRS